MLSHSAFPRESPLSLSIAEGIIKSREWACPPESHCILDKSKDCASWTGRELKSKWGEKAQTVHRQPVSTFCCKVKRN